jgi:hypothetical protein
VVQYSDDDVIEAPRAVVWRLLDEHLDDAKISTIHPLIQSQKTVLRTEGEVQLDRVIDVARKPRKSHWRITFDRPERFRWEVLESEGPWASGSYLELKYAEQTPRTTAVTTRGALTVLRLPLFASQERAVRTALNDLRTEDVFYLRRYRY